MIKLARNLLFPKGPIFLVHFVTNRCNANCAHCFIFSQKISPRFLGKELTLKEIEKGVSSLSSSLINVSLTGGEPFLRKDLVEIVNLYAQKAGLKSINISTNGSLPLKIRNSVKQMLKQNPETNLTVSLSIDNLGKKHDQNRRFPGLFERVLKTYRLLEALKSPKLAVSFNLTVTGKNENDLEKIFQFLTKRLGAKGVTSTAVRFGRGASKTNFNVKNYAFLNQMIDQGFLKNQLAGFQGFKGADFYNAKNILLRQAVEKTLREKCLLTSCQAGRLAAVLHANGDVYPCELLDRKIGNIADFDYSFPRLWESKKAQESRRFIRDSGCFCTYECFWGVNFLVNPKFYPAILENYLKIKVAKRKHGA